ncbi:MAG TPA: dTDP-4-dehydrorhamnose 3,5-epimerase [Vicinamibacterales bacterium]|nr:dTDP-4-dehydrorhamnose 3,5-epimerase [Vicinamibacterales bacterium]
MSLRFSETDLPGVILIEPQVFRDARGFFLETFHAGKYAAAGIPTKFLQDNQSSSVKNTLRGLHLQWRKPQGKLVRVVRGEVWDVAVDLRRDLPTFGRWTAVMLSANNFHQLYIPPGCAHGFCVLSNVAEVEYKCTEFYDPADEVGIAYDDPELAIPWPVQAPLLSVRDQHHPTLRELLEKQGERGVAPPGASILRGADNGL